MSGPSSHPEFDYDGEHDLTGDGSLVLLDTKGHTPGHQSLQVTFPDGRRYVLVGDAAYSRDAVESGEPQGYPLGCASWPGKRWPASAPSRTTAPRSCSRTM